MNFFLPNINSRSNSPVNLFKSSSKRKSSYKKHLQGSIIKSSLTPTRKSLQVKDLLDTLDPKAKSDEVHSIPLERDPLYIKLTSEFSKNSSKSKSPILKRKQTNISDNIQLFGGYFYEFLLTY